jgi:hypothetical protein
MENVEAGWYSDPEGKPCQRYWDGEDWTQKTRPVVGPEEKEPDKTPKVKKEMTSGTKWAWVAAAAGIAFLLFIFIAISSASNNVSDSVVDLRDAMYGDQQGVCDTAAAFGRELSYCP